MTSSYDYPVPRRYARVRGPFDAWRTGATRTPVTVVELNVGGCFISAEPEPGDPGTYSLSINLGDEGVFDVTAAVLYHRVDGSAVTFLNLPPQVSDRIRRAVDSARA
jgi:PilZ domain-containing protein